MKEQFPTQDPLELANQMSSPEFIEQQKQQARLEQWFGSSEQVAQDTEAHAQHQSEAAASDGLQPLGDFEFDSAHKNPDVAQDVKNYLESQPHLNDKEQIVDPWSKNRPINQAKADKYFNERSEIKARRLAGRKYKTGSEAFVAEGTDYQVIDESKSLVELTSLYAAADSNEENGKKTWINKIVEDKIIKGELEAVPLVKLTDMYAAAEHVGLDDTKAFFDKLIENKIDAAIKSNEGRSQASAREYMPTREEYKERVEKLIDASRKKYTSESEPSQQASSDEELGPDEEWVMVPDGPRQTIPGTTDDYQPMKRERRKKQPAEENVDEARKEVEEAHEEANDGEQSDENHTDPSPRTTAENNGDDTNDNDKPNDKYGTPDYIPNFVHLRGGDSDMTTARPAKNPKTTELHTQKLRQNNGGGLRQRLSKFLRREKVDMDTPERKQEKQRERHKRGQSTINALGGMAFGVVVKDGLGIYDRGTRSRNEMNQEYTKLGGNKVVEHFQEESHEEKPKSKLSDRAKNVIKEAREKRGNERTPQIKMRSNESLADLHYQREAGYRQPTDEVEEDEDLPKAA